MVDLKIGDFLYHEYDKQQIIFHIDSINTKYPQHHFIIGTIVDINYCFPLIGHQDTIRCKDLLLWSDKIFLLPGISDNSIKTCSCDMIKLMQVGCECGGI